MNPTSVLKPLPPSPAGLPDDDDDDVLVPPDSVLAVSATVKGSYLQKMTKIKDPADSIRASVHTCLWLLRTRDLGQIARCSEMKDYLAGSKYKLFKLRIRFSMLKR